MHFVQNTRFDRVADAMREFGMYRFMLCDGTYGNEAERPLVMLQKLLNDPWFQDKFELAIEHADHERVSLVTRDEHRVFPVWHLKTGNALDLKKMAEEHDIVFIKNKVKVVGMAARTTDSIMRRRIREMWEVVQAYGDPGLRKCKFIIYGWKQFQPYFCMGMSGGAIPPRETHGLAFAPGGKGIPFDPANAAYFANLLDIPVEKAENLETLNLRAFQLAPEYVKKFYENIDRVGGDTFVGKSLKEVDALVGRNYWVSTINKEYVLKRPHANVWATLGDERLCNSCSVAFSCRYYQRGAVCALPNSEGRSLSSLFGTRNSEDVIEGISKILQFQAQRFEEAAEDEYRKIEKAKEEGEDLPPINSDLTKLANDIQKNAKQYALLINPTLLKPQVSVNINNGTMKLEQSEVTPQLMATAARELEAAGYQRDQLTPSMLYEHIARGQGGVQVVESEVVDGIKRDF